MGILYELKEEMKGLEDPAVHDGYWHSIGNTLIVLVCGLLCGLQKIDDIHDWAKSEPTKEFLKEQFGIERIFCRAQFYNILGCVDAEKFKLAFSRWMQNLLHGCMEGKTVAIDGKTICGTDKLNPDGSVLHIASAIVSDYKLVIGSQVCDTKTGEINAFRELVRMLDVKGAVVVADALHCNPKSAKAVVDAKADYLFVVKDNQGALKADIEMYVKNEKMPSFSTKELNGHVDLIYVVLHKRYYDSQVVALNFDPNSHRNHIEIVHIVLLMEHFRRIPNVRLCNLTQIRLT